MSPSATVCVGLEVPSMLEELGDRFEHFQSLDSFEKSSLEIGLSTFRVLIVLRNHLWR